MLVCVLPFKCVITLFEALILTDGWVCACVCVCVCVYILVNDEPALSVCCDATLSEVQHLCLVSTADADR